MKEFEKWWQTRYESTAIISTSDYVMADITWRAALKWVLSRVEYANSDGSIIQDIKNELTK